MSVAGGMGGLGGSANEGDSSEPMRVLVVIDMQNDFVSQNGIMNRNQTRIDAAVAGVVELLRGPWDAVIATKDFHPPGHVSFVTERGQQPPIFRQHCVQNGLVQTEGAKFHPKVLRALNDAGGRGVAVDVFFKGFFKKYDSFGAVSYTLEGYSSRFEATMRNARNEDPAIIRAATGSYMFPRENARDLDSDPVNDSTPQPRDSAQARGPRPLRDRETNTGFGTDDDVRGGGGGGVRGGGGGGPGTGPLQIPSSRYDVSRHVLSGEYRIVPVRNGARGDRPPPPVVSLDQKIESLVALCAARGKTTLAFRLCGSMLDYAVKDTAINLKRLFGEIKRETSNGIGAEFLERVKAVDANPELAYGNKTAIKNRLRKEKDANVARVARLLIDIKIVGNASIAWSRDYQAGNDPEIVRGLGKSNFMEEGGTPRDARAERHHAARVGNRVGNRFDGKGRRGWMGGGEPTRARFIGAGIALAAAIAASMVLA